MAPVEHLVLVFVPKGFGGKFKTKYHDDLGEDLQASLEILEHEGWQVITSFYSTSQGARIILTRVPR